MTRNSFILFIVQFVVLVILICFVANLPAVEQFNLKQCQQLQEDLVEAQLAGRRGLFKQR